MIERNQAAQLIQVKGLVLQVLTYYEHQVCGHKVHPQRLRQVSQIRSQLDQCVNHTVLVYMLKQELDQIAHISWWPYLFGLSLKSNLHRLLQELVHTLEAEYQIARYKKICQELGVERDALASELLKRDEVIQSMQDRGDKVIQALEKELAVIKAHMLDVVSELKGSDKGASSFTSLMEHSC
jgi:hypothetical protein